MRNFRMHQKADRIKRIDSLLHKSLANAGSSQEIHKALLLSIKAHQKALMNAINAGLKIALREYELQHNEIPVFLANQKNLVTGLLVDRYGIALVNEATA